MHPTNTPSWPQFLAAKEAWNATKTNPNATEQERRTACNAYKAKMWQCLRESGL